MLKTAISVPASLLAEVDKTAKRRGETRSQFIQRLMREAVAAQNDHEFTERLNRYFASPANAKAHAKEVRQLSTVAAWPEEKW
jgi:metal-responsive CopG/Arc/MetJ family transcriptional regulator